MSSDTAERSTRASLLDRARELPTSQVGLGLLRIVIGITWLHEAQWKTPPDFSGLAFWLGQGVEHPTLGIWAAAVESLILPNLALFGWLTLLTEAALGGFLIVGLGTRLWAAIGAAQAVAITLTVISAPDEWSFAYYILVAAHLALLTGAAGRSLGLDGLLRDRWETAAADGSRLARLLWVTS